MHAGQRELDIVIYGATGFVGRLTAEYLAKAGAGIRVALAGRSAERLLAVRQALGAGAENWPLIVADLAQPAALTAMAARSQAVVSAVGPYSRRGLPVVAACATAGTDYADLTGEVPFVRQSIDRHHKQAVDNGARIVHSCGFDSIPSDLNVYALHRRILDDDAANGETTFVLRAYSGGFSGARLPRWSNDANRLGRSQDAADARRSVQPQPRPECRARTGASAGSAVAQGADIAPELRGCGCADI
jgi:short subunit dehydrogenase-like uncharacterized protein